MSPFSREGTLDLVINYLNYNSSAVLSFLLSLSFLVISILFILWMYNKKRYSALKHQIPADVVKNYLDSIIQNSTSLKSSLFRGGGLELGEGVPAVMPVRTMIGGESLSIGQGDSAQANAEISSLRAELGSKKTQVIELEGKCSDCGGKLKSAEDKIRALEEQLRAGGGGGGDAALQAQLQQTAKERDDLKIKLEEYAIIEDDLANLKKLKQENEQLRRSLGGGAPAPIEEAAPAAEPVSMPEVSAPVADAAPLDSGFDEMAQAMSQPDSSADTATEVAVASSDIGEAPPAEEKTPEDLLSEFEKMLG